MKVIIITDSVLFRKDPTLLTLNKLRASKKIPFQSKQIKLLEDANNTDNLDNATKVRLKKTMSDIVKNKNFVEVTRLLEITEPEIENLFLANTLKSLNTVANKSDSITVLVTTALDLFIEPMLEYLHIDTAITQSLLVVDNKFTGEYNFVLDEDFLLNFVRGLKAEKNDVYGIGDEKRDSYLLSLVDEQFDISKFDQLLEYL